MKTGWSATKAPVGPMATGAVSGAYILCSVPGSGPGQRRVRMCCRNPSCPNRTRALCRPHRRASRAQPGATRSGGRTRRCLCEHKVEVSITSDEQWRGQEQAKHTHRSLTASDYPSCCPDGDNRDAVQDSWSASATMVSDERGEVK